MEKEPQEMIFMMVKDMAVVVLVILVCLELYFFPSHNNLFLYERFICNVFGLYVGFGFGQETKRGILIY